MLMKFGERLKRLIKENGSSGKELAVKIGKDDQTVSRWVNGQSAPDAFDIEKICKVLNITVSELFGEVSLPDKLTPEIIEAIKGVDDPLTLNIILLTCKSSKEVKNTIKSLLDCLPNLTPEKRQAILALCK